MSPRYDPEGPLPTAEFHILLALLEGAAHGHGIKRDVEERTEGQVTLGPGTLYSAVKRMLERGMIREIEGTPGGSPPDARRRYYEITEQGHEAARTEARRMRALLDTAAERQLDVGWKSA